MVLTVIVHTFASVLSLSRIRSFWCSERLPFVWCRYLPSLRATFTFPQSLGIAGGKPRASTYLVGVQDDQAMYLDPHETQQVIMRDVCSSLLQFLLS